MAAFERKYGTGTGADIWIPIIKAGEVNFAVSGDWTPATGDVKITKDGGTAANIGTLPVALTMGNTALWKFVFADAELQAAEIVVTISDSSTKAVEDQSIIIDTYGNASAQHAVNRDDIVRSGLTALPNAAADAAGGLPISDAGGQNVDAAITSIAAIEVDTSTTLQGELDAIQAAVITNATGADIAADVIAMKIDTAATLVDTAEIGAAGAGLTAITTQQLTEAYASDGTAPTTSQALFQILAFLQEKNISGTTVTCNKLDGSTTAMTFTLDDANDPTSITRAT